MKSILKKRRVKRMAASKRLQALNLTIDATEVRAEHATNYNTAPLSRITLT